MCSLHKFEDKGGIDLSKVIKLVVTSLILASIMVVSIGGVALAADGDGSQNECTCKCACEDNCDGACTGPVYRHQNQYQHQNQWQNRHQKGGEDPDPGTSG